MSEFAFVKLRRDGDGIHAWVSTDGAITASTAKSMKEALISLGEALNVDDEPFWRDSVTGEREAQKVL